MVLLIAKQGSHPFSARLSETIFPDTTEGSLNMCPPRLSSWIGRNLASRWWAWSGINVHRLFLFGVSCKLS
eukprot:jgi/Picre1/32509/NNA_007855.t1